MTIYFLLSLYLDHFVEFQCFNPNHFVWKCFTRFSYNTAIKTKWMKKNNTKNAVAGGGRGVSAWGCLPRGCVSQHTVGREGVSAPVHAGIHPALWTEFLTHACENITFPELLLQTVKTRKKCPQRRTWYHPPNPSLYYLHPCT